jgi:hypothetical protein
VHSVGTYYTDISRCTVQKNIQFDLQVILFFIFVVLFAQALRLYLHRVTDVVDGSQRVIFAR